MISLKNMSKRFFSKNNLNTFFIFTETEYLIKKHYFQNTNVSTN